MTQLVYRLFALAFLSASLFIAEPIGLAVCYALMLFSFFIGEIADHNAEMRKLVACFQESKSAGKLDNAPEVK